MDWNSIVNEHGRIVLRIASRILGPHDAEDVAQEVFLKAYQLWNRSTVHNWPGLLRTIATRHSIDRLRCRLVESPLPVDLADTNPAPHQRLSTTELVNRLRTEIACLPDRQAEVFTLKYFDGLSNSEIARLLQISASNVSTSLLKARETLATRLIDLQCGDRT